MTTTTKTRGGAFRRIAGAASLAGGGLLTFAGFLTTPWETEPSTEAYLAANAASPTKTLVSATLLHFGYLLLVPAVIALVAVARRASPRLANTALVLGILGAGLNGIVGVDMYDLALGTTLPMEDAVRVYEAAGSYWAGAIMNLPSILGLFLGTVLAVAAAGRAGVTPRYLWAGTLAGWVLFVIGGFGAIPAAGLAGSGLLALTLIAAGVKVARSGDSAFA